ncbi:ExbD/TolR family protein [Cerasicoccus maritimus]|uniref:ExbD/TolR family protein n=1 Tax=Cerasicoccus maritimus TaxID=490089 RepID=UPI002852684E|nr:biopolymer transporter ExbD [Cerasicoccus maritimus]
MKRLRPRRKAEINIVPLIDVLIVLIFFFLMTMQFRNLNVLNITPPKMETAGKAGEVDQLVVGITPEGEYFLNNEKITEDEIKVAFAEAAQQEQKPNILVQADEDVPLKYVTFVMDESNKVELGKVRLQAR